MPSGRTAAPGYRSRVRRRICRTTPRPGSGLQRILIATVIAGAGGYLIQAIAGWGLTPSEYEGFGLTPLEALAAGVPPVVADTPVAREVYGDAAVFVRLQDIRETAAALRALLNGRARADAILARAPAVLARYSWATTADRTLEHIERVAPR